MKQIVQNYRTGVLKVEEVPAPMAAPGGLLVANHLSLISAGTEKSTVLMAQRTLAGKAMERPEMVRKIIDKIQKDGLFDTLRMVMERLDTPAALGYSCAGTVQEVGRGAGRFSVGERVACAGQDYASHAEVVSVPKNLCVKIPEGVELEEAAFVTVGAIALQGVRQVRAQLGECMAVVGLGLLGQLTVQILKACGCQVLASDLDSEKLVLAREIGADAVVLPDGLRETAAALTHGWGVDGVVITASTRDNGPLEIAGEITRKKGRIVVVGAVGMTLPRDSYYRKELELRMSTSTGPGRYDGEYEEKGHDYPYGYVRWTENRNMEAFLALVQQKKVNVKRLITHRYAIQEAERAYRLMLEGQEPYLGILLSYSQEPVTKKRQVVQVCPTKGLGRLNLGIIGAGHHVRDRLLPSIRGIKEVSVQAVCTRTGISAKTLAEKTKAAYCTSDYREILKDPSVDTVLIGTRHDTHGSLVVEALEAGKHVFVEKPLCLTEEELEAITAIYTEKIKAGIRLMVGFNRRFSSHAERIKAFFYRRRDPLMMTFRVNAGPIPPDHWVQDPKIGGGRVLGEVCHFVDYMAAVCGANPVSVHARRVGYHTSGITEDQCILSLGFEEGSVGTVVYTAGGDTGLAKERFEAFGSGKSAVIDDFEVSEFYDHGKKSVFKSHKQDKGFQAELNHFVQAIVHGNDSMMTCNQIYAVTRACLLALASLRTGQVYDV
jgi:predicted dehydrogenase/threonine dehydrogenase-like Zn-dependent dehydrogenase